LPLRNQKAKALVRKHKYSDKDDNPNQHHYDDVSLPLSLRLTFAVRQTSVTLLTLRKDRGQNYQDYKRHEDFLFHLNLSAN